MNRELPAMLEDALSRGFRAMVLTNAMKPMDKMKPALLRLRERFGDRLILRVSIDHYGRAVHELERGRRSWAPTIDGLVRRHGTWSPRRPRSPDRSPGYRARKRNSSSASMKLATGGSTVRRSRPAGLSRNVHVGGSTSATYAIQNTGTSGPSLTGAVQTNVNGGKITDPALTGSGVTAQNFGPLATGSGSTNPLTVSYNPTTAGPLSGQAVHVANNFGNVSEQTVSITGAAYALASPTVTSSLTPQFNFGVVQVGQTINDPLTIKNVQVASNAAFQEGLSASFGTPSTSFLTTNNGMITNLAPGGADNSSLVVSLHPTGTGTVSGTVPLTLTSVAVAGTGLSNTDLSQNLNYVWQFSGTVVNPANPSITPTKINFGNVRINTLQQQALSVSNIAGTPPQASLDAQIS